MSLGVNFKWRAWSLVQGLSLLPRESWLLLSGARLQPRRWRSSSAESPLAGEPEFNIIPETVKALMKTTSAPTPPPSTSPLSSSSSSSSSSALSPSSAVWRRAPSRHDIKKMLERSSRPSAILKRPKRYPSRRSSYRSVRKSINSAKRQALHEHIRDTLGKPVNDWRSTLDFMIRHTPKLGDLLDFRVVIGKAAAAQARSALSDLDTNLWQIQQKSNSKIRVEPGSGEDAPLVLCLSGTNISIQESLLEIVKAVGKISAIRILDPTFAIWSSEAWKDRKSGQVPIRVLNDEEHAAEDETVTVYGHADAEFFRMAQRRYLKLYQLTKRADEIPRPAVWTKSSFEQYVSRLVLGRIPTNIHQSLYPSGPDHQTTVCNILINLFSSGDLRAVMSVTALKMALRFIHSKGPVFPSAARIIFYQAQRHYLPLDAEAFQSFLICASIAGDLQGFNSVLRAMTRKGHYVRAESWAAFLLIVQDPQIKQYIMRRMKSRQLHRLESISEEMARQTMMINLESRATAKINMKRLLHTHDEKYGPTWLNTVTLNKMVDELGAQGNLAACHQLLNLVDSTRRVRPDHYTLNILITHSHLIPEKISLLSRWPGLSPDAVTYQLLFQPAWKQRLPNMLQVIWRYAALAGQTSSQMRHTLTRLMKSDPVLGKSRAFLKAWEDVILGGNELTTVIHMLRDGSNGFGAAQLMSTYVQSAGDSRPLVGLATKLREAYDMDMKIHKLIKEGTKISLSLRESLTVKIPLRDAQHSAAHVGDKDGSPYRPSVRRILN
ncbi:hypothetical protein GGS21DRAFT_525107 [Xylaria nigripes]|nr:hypothetical protein GGS21DRAFT_525107 [Xylaria nigripes]